MEKYFLAVDIGASSGRHILGSIKDGKIVLEEIYRFRNGAVKKGDNLVWDVKELFKDIVEGLKQCKTLNKIPQSVGIDTWGVDYALLDKNDNLIGDVISYRDERTVKVMDEVFGIIPESELYSRTGIRKQVFNTIFQLYCDKKNGKLDGAETFLMMPDYLHFLLTGVKSNEYTDASTTGMLSLKTRDWDYEIIEKLGFKKSLFKGLSLPGTVIGNLKPEIVKEVGFDCNVCIPATHDTASAVMAVPETGTPLYISSGTWSLIGIETQKENSSESANAAGFTNEGGYDKSVRFLKNIMGMWMIQCVKKELNDKYSFTDFVALAKEAENFKSVIEVNDQSFFSPESMITAVKDYCIKTGQTPPETVGELAICIYKSLALSYKRSVEQIQDLTGVKFDKIHIVGGGCQNQLMNSLTAEVTKMTVVTGPVEATAVGNIVAQMTAAKVIENLNKAKEVIRNSFDIKEINA